MPKDDKWRFLGLFLIFWNYLDNSQQFVSCCLGKCRPLFSSVDQFCVCRAKLSLFALKQSLNSQSKNYRSISRQFVMFVVGRSTLKHLKLFLNVGRLKLMWHRLTTKNQLKVNWSIRQFWQLGWLTTDRIRITLNINRLSVGKRRLG